jgi:hypothetical protein
MVVIGKTIATFSIIDFKITTQGTGKGVQPNDIVPYRPSNAPLENHHGVLDVWAKHNVPNYVSRGADTPTIALTQAQHNATKAVYREGWRRCGLDESFPTGNAVIK